MEIGVSTLTGADSFVVTGPFSYGDSTLSGSGSLDAYGGIDIHGSAWLDGRTLNNHGVAALSSDGLAFAHSAVFNNEANAIFDDQTDGTIGNSGAAGTFNNAGTFTKSAGTGTTAIGVPFNNTGTASVSSGTLAFQGGGTSTGPYTGATGTTLDFEGLQSLAGAVSGNTVSFGSNGGAGNQGVTLSGTYSATTATNFGDVAGPFVHGTTVLFTGPVTQVGSLTLAFSTADFGPATPVTLTVPTLNVAYGTLTGTDSFTATGPFNFTEATVSGSGTIDAYGGIPAPFGALALDGVTLNNYATATLTRDGIGFAHGAVFNNEANAIFDDQTDGTIGNSGAAARSTTPAPSPSRRVRDAPPSGCPSITPAPPPSPAARSRSREVVPAPGRTPAPPAPRSTSRAFSPSRGRSPATR